MEIDVKIKLVYDFCRCKELESARKFRLSQHSAQRRHYTSMPITLGIIVIIIISMRTSQVCDNTAYAPNRHQPAVLLELALYNHNNSNNNNNHKSNPSNMASVEELHLLAFVFLHRTNAYTLLEWATQCMTAYAIDTGDIYSPRTNDIFFRVSLNCCMVCDTSMRKYKSTG